MSFKKDLADGEEAEKEFGEFLRSRGFNLGFNTSKTITEKRFYDLWASPAGNKGIAGSGKPKVGKGEVKTFEIKFDRRVKETGNIYVEHEALGYSKADSIVYKLDSDGKFYIIPRTVLIAAIKDNPYKQVSGGDRWGRGSLISEALVKELFTDVEKAFT